MKTILCMSKMSVYKKSLQAMGVFLYGLFCLQIGFAAIEKTPSLNHFVTRPLNVIDRVEPSLIFDLPVEYNSQVRNWIHYFQTSGKSYFKLWLERYSRVSGPIQSILMDQDLPQDLVYMAMIESGFSSKAVSSASAVGPWQFIRDTGQRFGLQIRWWIDERRDLYKSTRAASAYIKYLYKMFGSWYLVAAAYNTGENRVKRLMRKHNTRNFWTLARRRALHPETINYVPKLIAAMLISKAPGLYGFRNLNPQPRDRFEYFMAPGGISLLALANHLKISDKLLTQLNPELIVLKIPRSVKQHRIRIPVNSSYKVSEYLRTHFYNKQKVAQRD